MREIVLALSRVSLIPSFRLCASRRGIGRGFRLPATGCGLPFVRRLWGILGDGGRHVA